ncbi:MAG TPA: hypothetical protein VFA89_04105 [Terriglobales bacterium]|nr:hypothetical protein [Terriglobales bacterium]
MPATGVTFWAHIIPPSQGDPATYVEFLADAKSISFSESGGGHDCNVDFAVFMVGRNGNVNNLVIQSVDTPLPDAQYASVRKRGLPFRMQIKALPKEGDLRLAVRDNRTGLLGTLTIPIASGSLQAGVAR